MFIDYWVPKFYWWWDVAPLAAGMNTLVTEFDRPLTTISYLVGGFMLSLGCGSASPTAVLFGKRLVYIGGIFIFMMGAIGVVLQRFW